MLLYCYNCKEYWWCMQAPHVTYHFGDFESHVALKWVTIALIMDLTQDRSYRTTLNPIIITLYWVYVILIEKLSLFKSHALAQYIIQILMHLFLREYGCKQVPGNRTLQSLQLMIDSLVAGTGGERVTPLCDTYPLIPATNDRTGSVTPLCSTSLQLLVESLAAVTRGVWLFSWASR